MTLSSRSSEYLASHEGSRLCDAIVFAYCNGWAFNRHVIIHFGKAHIQRAHPALMGFLKRAGDWLRKRGGQPAAYVWVLECPPPDFGKGGLHVHIMIHVPRYLQGQFDIRVQGWLLGRGRQAPKGAILLVPMFYSSLSPRDPRYIEHGLLGLTRYFLKGLEPAIGNSDIDCRPQGPILGKRSGYSEALGLQHRWKRIPVGGRAWVGGPDVKMKRWVRYHFPELLGLAD